MIPEFQTNRLELRALVTTDALDVFDYAQDIEVANPGMWRPYEDFEHCQKHIDHLVGLYDRGLMWWALKLRENQKVIGRVELSDWEPDDDHAELSYALGRQYWRQGLMTEAIEPVLEFGWNVLKLHRLQAKVLEGNVASICLLLRIGMEKEGVLRDYKRIGGRWYDAELYGAVRPEK